MLVVTRRPGEQIVIGEGEDAIVIYVTSLDVGKVRIGIDAPRSVKILRRELLSLREKDELERAGR